MKENIISAENELCAVLSFLRKNGIRQGDLEELRTFPSIGTEVATNIHSARISAAKKKDKSDYYKGLYHFLRDHFGLQVNEKENDLEESADYGEKKSYTIIINSDTFHRNRKMLRDSIDMRKGTSSEAKDFDQYGEYEETTWMLYNRRSRNKGIERHILALGSNGEAHIYNASANRHYRGKYHFESTCFLITVFRDAQTNNKYLSMCFSIGLGRKPTLCLGIYTNTGETDMGIIGETVILELQANKCDQPGKFTWSEAEEIEDIDPYIISYLEPKRLNSISTPSKVVKSLAELKRWLDEKRSLSIDPTLSGYIGSYRLYCITDDALRMYHLRISIKAARIEGLLYSTTDKEHFVLGEGEIERTDGSTLCLNLKRPGQQFNLRFDAAGDITTHHECYRGLVCGAIEGGHGVLAYQVIILRESAHSEEAVRQIEAKLKEPEAHHLRLSSPESYKLRHL